MSDTLTVNLPVLPMHQSMLVACYLREAPYLVAMPDRDAVRCLTEAASAVARGREFVSLTTTRQALGPLASACRELAEKTYAENAARPVLLGIATAAEVAS